MEKKYTKLSELVGKEFTIEKAYGFQWKKWDAESNRMLLSEKYEQGFRKIYSLETDKGKLDVPSSQLGNLLESVYRAGQADLIGKTFSVKSNGKTGIDIRYYFNPVQVKKVQEEVDTDEPMNLDSIPF